MKKLTLLGALVLAAAAPPVLAQTSIYDADSESTEGHLSMAPNRDEVRTCKAEAAQRNLSGGERRSYISACQKRMMSAGPSSGGMTASGGSTARTLGPMRDADGRFPQDVAPSRWVNAGPSADSGRSAIPDTDAEGRPRYMTR